MDDPHTLIAWTLELRSFRADTNQLARKCRRLHYNKIFSFTTESQNCGFPFFIVRVLKKKTKTKKKPQANMQI